MERICEPENLNRAYKLVKKNRGRPGIDGMTVAELAPWLEAYGEDLVASLLDGSYEPEPVRGVEIPKPGGGMRQLGIPTAKDRLVQQATLHVLDPMLDPTFSESSYGFRPGRSAHQAVRKASEYVAAGRPIVVDVDLEKFFDRVNHDVLMGRLARRIADKRLLRIIHRMLEAGIMKDGVVTERYEGTPQGGPLSPLLANLLLDELDKELETRGHRFCRYGRLGIAPKSLERAKDRIREITRRNRGVSLERVISELNSYLTGWVTYFRHANAKGHLQRLDEWIRRKLRCVRLKQRKRAKPIADFLMQLGVPEWRAWRLALSGKGWWRMAGSPPAAEAMTLQWLKEQGLVSLTERYLALQTPS